MSLIRFSNPTFRSSFLDSFLDRQWEPARFHNGSFPAVNVHEEEKSFVIELAAPGKTKKDFKIELDNDVLTLSSTDVSEKEGDEAFFKQKEFSIGAFQRQFVLPDTIETSKIKVTH